MDSLPCRKCGVMIGFIKQLNGKRHPVDAESFAAHALGPGIVVVTPEGRILRGSEMSVNLTAQGYISHFTTCPYANEFRKSHERKE